MPTCAGGLVVELMPHGSLCSLPGTEGRAGLVGLPGLPSCWKPPEAPHPLPCPLASGFCFCQGPHTQSGLRRDGREARRPCQLRGIPSALHSLGAPSCSLPSQALCPARAAHSQTWTLRLPLGSGCTLAAEKNRGSLPQPGSPPTQWADEAKERPQVCFLSLPSSHKPLSLPQLWPRQI